MKNIDFKLIVSDFDGTLLGNHETVSKENKEAIEKYINAGGIFAISTGRMPDSILPQVRKLGLKGLVCCCQGTIILDIESGNVVFEESLPLKTTLAACMKMEEMGLHILAFDLWDYYSNSDGELLTFYQNAAKTKATVVKDMKLSDFLREKQISAYKLIALVDPKDNSRVFEELKKAQIPNCDVTKSMDFLVEIVNPTLCKGTSVRYLAEKYGIPMEKTIAIGDNYNDISMIKCAGKGVAVANGEDLLKENADYVCQYTNDESAVASIIEQFGFCQ